MISKFDTTTISSSEREAKLNEMNDSPASVSTQNSSKDDGTSLQLSDDIKSNILLAHSDKHENEPELQDCLLSFEKLVKAWEGHRVVQAHTHLMEFEEKAKQAQKSLSSSSQKFLSSLCDDNSLLFQDCKSDYNFTKMGTEMFNDHEGWTTESIGKDLTTKYKKIPRTALISLRFEAILDIPLINVLTLLYEIDLYNEWIPFLTKSDMLSNVHRASKVVYIKASLPPPLADRDAFLYGFGVDHSNEDGSVMILAKSLDTDPELMKRHKVDPSKTSKNVKMDLNFACFKIKPLGPNRCEMLGVANVDPKISFLPSRLLNWLVRKTTTLLVERMLKKAQTLAGTPWEKAMENPEKKEFYDWLNAKVAEVLAKKEREM
jgi:hypothetical protein